MQKKGIALSSLFAGIVALMTGWVPVLGAIIGAAAITLGVIGLIKKQPKAFSLTGLILGAVAALTSIVMTIVLIAAAVTSPALTTPVPAPITDAAPPEKPAGIPIPDLTGIPADEAAAQLKELGFKTEFNAGEETVIMSSNWNVTSTTPAAGQHVEDGANVTIHVEKPAPPPVQATDLGLTGSTAWTVCTQAGNQMFPYGFRFHLTGIMADQPQGDVWFVKATTTTENEFGNKRKDLVMECYVTGTDATPELQDFLVYQP